MNSSEEMSQECLTALEAVHTQHHISLFMSLIWAMFGHGLTRTGATARALVYQASILLAIQPFQVFVLPEVTIQHYSTEYIPPPHLHLRGRLKNEQLSLDQRPTWMHY
jgi:hypothetical protein